ALDPDRYDAITVEIGRDGRWELGTGKSDGSVAETLPVPTAQVPATLGEVDVVFPVLHGPFGEDGTVQGLLELAGVPYVGEDELPGAVELAFRHDEKVLVEEFVDGVEVECGVLGNDQPLASLPGEIVSHGFSGADWYDYSAKYDEGGMDLIVPPRLPQETAE